LLRYAKLLKRFNVIWPVQPDLQKYSCFPQTQITSISSAVLSPRGALAIVTDVGRDAVDAAASGVKRDAGQASACERSDGALTNDVAADGEVVWS
jgi:hypothetical protein